MEDLRGRTAVITGGASGSVWRRQSCWRRRGQLVLADIEQGALDAAVAEFSAAGVGARRHLRRPPRRQALADEAFDALGACHIVFNNAGVAVGGPIAEMSHDDWRWIIDVDLWGPIHGVEAFLPRMIEQRDGGHVLFTASFAGLVPNVGLGRTASPSTASSPSPRCCSASCASTRSACPCCARCGWRPTSATPSATGPPTTAARRRHRRCSDQDEQQRRPRRPGPRRRRRRRADRRRHQHNRLYVLPHEESRRPRRRFERIDRTFDDAAAFDPQ